MIGELPTLRRAPPGLDLSLDGRLAQLSGWPAPILLATMLALSLGESRAVFDPAWLLFTLNIALATVPAAIVIYLVGRAFYATGRPEMILLGCGVALWGVGTGLCAPLSQGDANVMVTVHNLSAWFAALCHLIGIIVADRRPRAKAVRGWWVLGAWAVTFGVLGASSLAAVARWTPLFFVQGEGGTLIRTLVLASAALMFLLSALALHIGQRRQRTAFNRWYAHGLVLIAFGFFGLIHQTAHGTPLSWVGRVTLWIGGWYFAAAAWSAARESGTSQPTIAVPAQDPILRYALPVVFVTVAIVIRLVFLDGLGGRSAYILYYPAIVFAVLFGGTAAGLIAAALGALAGNIVWLEGGSVLALSRVSDWTALVLFIFDAGVIVWVTHALRRAQLRAAAAEIEMTVARERKRADTAVREADEKLRLALDNIVDVVHIVDRDGRLMYLNTVARSLLTARGRPAAEQLGQDILAAVYPEARDTPFGQALRRALEDHESSEIASDAAPFGQWYASHFCPTADGAVMIFSSDMTARRRAEEQLRQSEERFRQMAAAVDSVYWLMEWPERRVAYVSPAFERIWGIDPARVYQNQRLWWDYIHSADRARVERAFLADAERGRFDVEYRIVLDDGRVQWVHDRCFPVRDVAGRVVRLAGVVEDITTRKDHEDRLAEQARLLDLTADAIFVRDPDERIVYWNRGAEELYGWRADEAIGQFVHDVLDTEFPTAIDRIRAELATRRRWRGELTRYDRHGQQLCVDARWTVVDDPEGNVTAILEHNTNITQQKEAERALRRSEEQARHQFAELDAIYRTAPLGLCVLTTDLRFTRINDRMAEMNGISVEQHLGRSVRELLPSVADQAEQIRAQVLATGGEVRFELRGETPAQPGVERVWDERWYPLHDANGVAVGIGVVAEEITARKRTEAALALAQIALREHADTLERTVAERTARLRETIAELEAFSYSIAHDMRAPLRSMRGFAEILATEYGTVLQGEGQDYLRRIGRSAERLDALIQDVLNYSRVVHTELKLEPIAVGPLVHDLIRSYPNLQSFRAELHVIEPLPTVEANLASLTQVLSNLLANAVKFVPRGSRPHVTIRSEPAQREDYVRLVIEDRGIGISPEAQQRLFHMFQRLHRPELYEGTGMGLAIVRKAVERMGGQVGVESAPECGSRFWVELRRARLP